MAKTTLNNELLQLMDDYKLFMQSPKSVALPIVVTDPKKNHPKSKYYEAELTAGHPFGTTVFDCEIRDRVFNSYSFQIRSDKFVKSVVLRFDEGDATHRNNAPGIPLEEQSISTPHFHKYNDAGYFIAYKNNELKQLGQVSLSLTDGFDVFCREAKIDTTGYDIRIQEADVNGNLEMNFNQPDPLAGVMF